MLPVKSQLHRLTGHRSRIRSPLTPPSSAASSLRNLPSKPTQPHQAAGVPPLNHPVLDAAHRPDKPRFRAVLLRKVPAMAIRNWGNIIARA